MTILVTFASRHGNARGIAEAIAAELESRGHHTVFSDVSRVASLDGFDAVVVGSGLYHGRWLPQTLAFLDHFQPKLATVPVWIFCSGPLGNQQITIPLELQSRKRSIQLMGHRCFHGSIYAAPHGMRDGCAAGSTDRAADEFRDWNSVGEWARRIGTAIAPMPPPRPTPQVLTRA